jgi:TfoX/Sxy family transcriptional regulator of competence genes
MAVNAELRQQVDADILKRGEVTTRDMMGTTAYMVRGRMFAFWVADGLVAKLSDHARQDMIDRKQGVLFQGPQGRGFGDWTRLELEKKDDIEAVHEAAKSAYEYVRGSLKPKERKKSKK